MAVKVKCFSYKKGKFRKVHLIFLIKIKINILIEIIFAYPYVGIVITAKRTNLVHPIVHIIRL